jgi:hypothetical protein
VSGIASNKQRIESRKSEDLLADMLITLYFCN